jgi:flavin reductase (DIM6/NTAB) family NADH-FMN oxidoreductase RutF
MELDPTTISMRDRYKLLIGCIVPRPIALVSTRGRDGSLNLAPFSFFCGVSATPMSLLFCPANKPDGSMKDTLRNASPPEEGGTGEFVVNVVTEAIGRQVVACAEPLEYGVSEFDAVGLTARASAKVGPPRVAESPVSLECRTSRVMRLNPGVPAGGNLVIGEVVYVHAAEGVVNQQWHTDPAALRAIGRMGGLGYCRTAGAGTRFEMPMGLEALQG